MSETDVNRLWERLAGCPAVEAIALGGSRATGKADETSDYDVYVYLQGEFPACEREKILGEFCDPAGRDTGPAPPDQYRV